MSTSGSTPVTAARPGPNPWLVIGGVFTVLLIAAGTLSVVGWLGHRYEIQHQVYAHDTDQISVEIGTGDVTLTPGDPGRVSVERRLRWTYAKPTFDEHWDGQTLRVSTDCRGEYWPGPGCGIDYRLEVPDGVSAHVRTSTGDIEVRNLRGELRLETSTGDVVASDISSPVVDVSTGTGDIRLRFAEAPRTVSTDAGTGDITIMVPDSESYRIQTDTSVGDIRRQSVPENNASDRSITVRTRTGDIFVGAST